MKNNKTINYIIVIVFIFVISFAIYYVISDEKKEKSSLNNSGNISSEIDDDVEEAIVSLDMDDEVKIVINNKQYTLKLENNQASFDLLSVVPLNVEMSDLNNNEKYVYLNFSISEEGNYTGSIKKGDVMLYQSNCLVIFYKDFETDYHYTKIGHIDNLANLDSKSINVIIG